MTDDSHAEVDTLWPDLFVSLTPARRRQVLAEVARDRADGWVGSRDHVILHIDRLDGLSDQQYLHRLTAISGRRRAKSS